MKKSLKLLSVFISIIILALCLTSCSENIPTDTSTSTTQTTGNKSIKNELIGTWVFEESMGLDNEEYGKVVTTLMLLEDGTFIKKSVFTVDKEKFINDFIAEANQKTDEEIESFLKENNYDSVEDYANDFYKTELEEGLLVDLNYEKKGVWTADDNFIYMHYEADLVESPEGYTLVDGVLQIGRIPYQKNFFK